jgi:hypothetical protein
MGRPNKLGKESIMNRNEFLEEIEWYAEPLYQAISNEEYLKAFFAEFGYKLNEEHISNASSGFKSLTNAVTSILQSPDGTDESFHPEDLLQLFSGIKSLGEDEVIRKYFGATFFNEIFDYLLYRFLTIKRPVSHAFLLALGVIESQKIKATDPNGRDLDYFTITFNWSKIAEFVTNNKKWAKDVYGWSGNPDKGEKQLDYDFLFHTLEFLIESTGLSLATIAIASEREIAEFLKNTNNKKEYPSAIIPIHQDIIAGIDKIGNPIFSKEAGFKFLPYGDLHIPQNLGFALAPYVVGEVSGTLVLSEKLVLNSNVSGKATGGEYITITPTGISNNTGGSIDGGFELEFIYSNTEDGSKIILLNIAETTTIEVSAITFQLGGNINGDFYLGSGFKGLEASLDMSNDELLHNFIKEPVKLQVGNILVGWRFGQGIYFESGDYLGVRIPLHLNFGPIEISEIGLQFNLTDTPEFLLDVNTNLTLGPLFARVEGFGIFTYLVPAENGILGKYDLSLGFKPPTGIVISIDSNGFTGGGFLFFDEARKEYTGGLELEFKESISINAIGILTTLMPDGSKGFSLLLIITSEFTPIQLGFGFTLNGVGGLIGINRTCEVEVLQSGVKDGTLDHLLFPQDIVANANLIVSEIKKVFPVQEDQYVFGPMAELGWGTPPIITVQAGLLIEIPDPVRIAILGVLKALLPDENLKLLSLQVNFLGVIDFEKGTLSFDASLFDSKLLTFTLSGDMALRLNWGKDPVFVLSVGGFHPAYDPPANIGIGHMERLGINLFPTNNPRLRIETYFAVTSNTAQFGANGQLYVAVSKFEVEGYIGFDVLFRFSPFYFIAWCHASLSVSAFGEEILTVGLDLKLDGPTPWHANGTASFKAVIRVKVSISLTFGGQNNTRLASINVMELLVAALANQGNWEAARPEESNLLVTLRQIETNDQQIIAHPFGILTASQKLVPLDITISKFGNQAISGDRHFSIAKVHIGDELVSFQATREEFAPAQFFKQTDEEKLASKDFELYHSGVSIDGAGELKTNYVSEREVVYEFRYLHRKNTAKSHQVHPDLFKQLIKGNAVSKSKLSSAIKSPSVLGTRKVSVRSEQFLLANVDDLGLLHADYVFNSEWEAKVKMKELVHDDPLLKSKIQVVPAYEASL